MLGKYNGLLLATALAMSAANPPANLIRNAGFEQALSENGWKLDPAVVSKGMSGQSIFAVHSGRYSLRLVANSSNADALGGNQFGLGQQIPAEPYRGKPLYFSGWIRGYAGGTAVLRLVAVASSGSIWYRELREGNTAGPAVLRRDVLDVPDVPDLATIVLTCQVDGQSGSAFFDDVMVSDTQPDDWSLADGAPDPGPDYAATIEIQAGQVVRDIPRSLYGMNVEWVWGGYGLWDAEKRAPNPHLAEMTHDLGTTLLRFPGGFFSDFYHWHDGIGPPELRPPGRQLAAADLSPNDFGTDEVLSLADNAGAQVLFTVNVLTGTPEEAADWVRYVNANGRRVTYWEIGNEPYVDLSTFDSTISSLPPEEYARRFLEFARAMKAADPGIQVGAALDFNYGYTTYKAYPHWTDVLLKEAGQEIDFVSVHNAFAPALGDDAGWDARTVYTSMLGAPLQIRDTLSSLSQKIESALGKDSKVKIAISEWGPLFQDHFTSRFIDHVKTLGSALYAASAMMSFLENPRTELAMAFKLVDHLAMGWIGARQGDFAAKSPYYALQLFTQHFGDRLVTSTTTSPGYATRSIGWVDALPNVPYLDSVSSLSADGQNLYLIAVNKNFDRGMDTRVALHDFCPDAEGEAWVLEGTALDANTGTEIVGAEQFGVPTQATVEPGSRFYQGGPGEVGVDHSSFPVGGTAFWYSFPARSVTALAIHGRAGACVAPAN